jgi:hypothetical protein
MDEQQGFKSCLKSGCIGCASIIAVGFGLIFLLSIFRATSDQEPKFEEKRAERTLPAPPRPPALPEQAEQAPLPSGPPGSFVEVERLPSVELGAPQPGAGRVIVDFSMGSFEIKPGPADQPIRVDADFDSSLFELEERLVENDDGTWTYKVHFGPKGGFFGMLMRGGGKVENRLELVIPRGHPLALEGRIKMGESNSDLGGLWLTKVDLEYKMGDHFIEFREPSPFPLSSFEMKGSMGKLELRNLGNASPATIDIEQKMGELFLDLQGLWRRDAQVDVEFKMGECRIWLPDNARAEVIRASVGLGESVKDPRDQPELPPDAPTIKIEARGNMGELRIER